jgi:hypothetical protein
VVVTPGVFASYHPPTLGFSHLHVRHYFPLAHRLWTRADSNPILVRAGLSPIQVDGDFQEGEHGAREVTPHFAILRVFQLRLLAREQPTKYMEPAVFDGKLADSLVGHVYIFQ